jgi:hypothetical protein
VPDLGIQMQFAWRNEAEAVAGAQHQEGASYVPGTDACAMCTRVQLTPTWLAAAAVLESASQVSHTSYSLASGLSGCSSGFSASGA